MTEIDVLVAGAGVTGLAAAAALTERGLTVCIVDPRPGAGMEASTHNSGVIHAGLYYAPGSLKAQLCLEGRDRLFAFCESRGVPARRTGKLVAGSGDAERSALEALACNAAACGARVSLIDRAALRALEPEIEADYALWSPDTGIVDAARYVQALRASAEQQGATLLLRTSVVSGVVDGDAMLVATEREQIRARVVVNAAGLFADDVSARLDGETFELWPCRGDYATIHGGFASRVSRPVYPVPDPSGHGLGVHLTPTLDGELLLGPTIRAQTSKTDYEEGRMTLEAFHDAARRLAPGIPLRALREGESGIRAKRRVAPDEFPDFLIRPDARQPRLIHAAGIDSPGLTASLAVGRMVAALVQERL